MNESGAVVEGQWWGKVILSNTNPTRTSLRSNPRLSGEKTATNHTSHCTAMSTLLEIPKYLHAWANSTRG